MVCLLLFFFQAEDGIRDLTVTGVQTCALPISALAGPLGSSAVGDSARVFRVGAWAARSWLGWEAGGVKAGVEAWGPLPMDLRVPPVLDELGENLLRACPAGGVLLTAGDADFYAAWYMRFARGLRPDLLVLPLAAWRSDAVLRARLMADLKLGRRGGDDAWLAELVRRRPVCVSMAFDRPPETRPRIRWETRPLVWVAGPEGKSPRVPPREDRKSTRLNSSHSQISYAVFCLKIKRP